MTAERMTTRSVNGIADLSAVRLNLLRTARRRVLRESSSPSQGWRRQSANHMPKAIFCCPPSIALRQRSNPMHGRQHRVHRTASNAGTGGDEEQVNRALDPIRMPAVWGMLSNNSQKRFAMRKYVPVTRACGSRCRCTQPSSSDLYSICLSLLLGWICSNATVVSSLFLALHGCT